MLIGTKDYTEFNLNHEIHRMKIGLPTRELWIDGEWYSLCFNEKPIAIRLANQDCNVFLEKADLQVDIGKVERRDLCLGIFFSNILAEG